MSQRPIVLRNLHKNLQRLASLAICVSGASPTRPNTAVRLGGTYQALVGRNVSTAPSEADRVVAYLSDRALIRKYGARNASELREQLASGRIKVDLQDWWLSAEDLRSRTGGEREQSFVKTVSACQELDLLADRTLTITSYGKLLIDVAHERRLIPNTETLQTNPFAFDAPYGILAFHRVVSYDLPMQREIASAFGQGLVRFQDLCLQAEPILRSVLDRDIPNSPATRSVRAWTQKQIDNARKLAGRVREAGWTDTPGASVQTLYRPFEDIFLPRLEFMVDAGLVTKPEPTRYTYKPTDYFEAWAELMRGGAPAIDNSYFSVVAQIHGRRAERLRDPSTILSHMSAGFAKYRGLTGYAPILEAVAYSNYSTWGGEPWVFVELSDSMEALRRFSSSDQPSVRILSDRFRRPHAFTLIAA